MKSAWAKTVQGRLRQSRFTWSTLDEDIDLVLKNAKAFA